MMNCNFGFQRNIWQELKDIVLGFELGRNVRTGEFWFLGSVPPNHPLSLVIWSTQRSHATIRVYYKTAFNANPV
jgi:hypothetical protein